MGVEGDWHQVQGPRRARDARSEESIILFLDRIKKSSIQYKIGENEAHTLLSIRGSLGLSLGQK